MPIACDGAPHSFTLPVPASVAGPPFAKAKAVVSASVTAGAFPAFETASVGPQTIKLV